MDVGFSVELGRDDERLEFPWISPDGELRYLDLRRQPELLLEVPEACNNRELGEFLATLNSPASLFSTAKCDTWMTNELSEEEAIYGAAWKFASYVDLIYEDEGLRFSFERHEESGKRMEGLLKTVPEISAAAEFVLRRCSFQREEGEPASGFYFTFYLFGYGDDEEEARRRWSVAMTLVQNALLQLSAEQRRAAK